MTKFSLSRTSKTNLQQIHPDLVRVVNHALSISPLDFRIIEGRRNEERQRQLVRNGRSRTLNSRHLTGHAVDIAPWVNRQIPWDDWASFARLAEVMKKAARSEGVSIHWGGDWVQYKDGSHYELSWHDYPL